MKNEQWFANCPKGLESLLLHELQTLGAESVRETVAGCAFVGPLAVAYRVALWSRLANRVLLPIAELAYSETDSKLTFLKDLVWEDYLPVGRSFAIDFSGESRAIRNTQYGAQVCRDAISDRFREMSLARPNGMRKGADVQFQVRMRKGKLKVSLDFAGCSLHQRGYRREAGGAPLKENLAAALLLRADWPAMASRGGALVDPMCGSGTLLLEGAMMAADIAPGLARQRWGFEQQSWHNKAQWQALVKDAQGRAERGRTRELPEIRGYDADKKVLFKAQANIDRAGLSGQVRVAHKALDKLKKPTHKSLPDGLVICNPPYGERLGDRKELPALYRLLGDTLLAEFGGWKAAIFTADKALGKAMGVRSSKQYALFNGALPSTLLLFDLIEEQRMSHPPAVDVDSISDTAGEEGPQELSSGAQMFANRMRKNLQQTDRWARKQGLECYRVYDADMPEYAVAVDRYGSALHVAEYRAPVGVDESAAERRLAEIKQVLPQVTDCTSIHYKRRQRQRGAQQYEKTGRKGEYVPVREGAAALLVNLEDYLDTGLFLDHRPLRLRLGVEARDKDFLNLYCYTGTATVHAALGGARTTTSVDMSNTYLDWAGKNLAANRLAAGEVHRLVRADCQVWLEQQSEQYDLILLDPPSFSNSKRMEDSFDVQRDHPGLIGASMACLRQDGQLYFSNNLRSFKLEAELEERYSIEDISRSTIDFDFKRKPRIHRCWRISHK